MVGAEWKVGGGRALRDPGRSSMSQVVIENPIINSPFDEPTRHFRFSDEGITDEIGDGRRNPRGGPISQKSICPLEDRVTFQRTGYFQTPDSRMQGSSSFSMAARQSFIFGANARPDPDS